MPSRKYYSSELRDSAGRFSGSSSSYDPAQSTSHLSNYEPRQSKVESEKYVTKQDSKRVSENVTKSVVTRSVVDRRTSSSYTSKEESNVKQTRAGEGLLGRRNSKGVITTGLSSASFLDRGGRDNEAVTDAEEKGKAVPVSSFYSSYYKDEDLSGTEKVVDSTTDDAGDPRSAFYRSSESSLADIGRRSTTDRNERSTRDSKGSTDYRTERKGAKIGDCTTFHFSNSAAENYRRKSKDDMDASENRASRRITLEDANILRRALERKQASDSLERDLIEKRLLHKDETDDSSVTGTSGIYSSFDSRRRAFVNDAVPNSRATVSGSLDTDRRPGVSDSLTRDGHGDFTRYGPERGEITDRLKKYDLATEKPGRSPRRSEKDSPGRDRKRSLSSEARDPGERSKLGIYREIPGRKEFLAFTSGSANVAPSRVDEHKISREYRREESVDRYVGSAGYREKRDDGDTDFRFKRRPSDEMNSKGKDEFRDRYPSERGRHLSRQGKVERDEPLTSEGVGRSDTSSRHAELNLTEKEPSTRSKLKEDIAKLKAETESREIKKDYVPISPYSTGRESLVRDKLREDIMKLKLETLTREHKRPDVAPHASRLDVSDVPRANVRPAEERNLETLTREHKRHDVPPHASRADVSDVPRANVRPAEERNLETLAREHKRHDVPPHASRADVSEASRTIVRPAEERKEPSIQDKLRADIAKLKADTKDLSSFQRTAFSDLSSPRHAQNKSTEERRDARRSEHATSSSVKEYRMQDGDAFNDDFIKGKAQRRGSYNDPSDRYTKHMGANVGEKPDDSTYRGRWPSEEGTSRQYLRRQSTQGSGQPSLNDIAPSWSGREGQKPYDQKDAIVSRWDDPGFAFRGDTRNAAQAYATKKVFRADSTVSVTSRRENEGPPAVRGFYRGSVSKEDHEAYFTRGHGDVADGYPSETARRSDEAIPMPYPGYAGPTQQSTRAGMEARRRSDEAIPMPYPGHVAYTQEPTAVRMEAARRSDEAIVMPYPGYGGYTPERARGSEPSSRPGDAIPLPYSSHAEIAHKPNDDIISPRAAKDDPSRTERTNKELRSNTVHTSRDIVARNIIRQDSVISESRAQEEYASQDDTSRRFPERSTTSIRKPSIGRRVLPEDEKQAPTVEEDVAPVTKVRNSSGISALRKKIDELKNKVDSLDESRSRQQLNDYVVQHSVKKPDVEVKKPVPIRRYKLSERRSETSSIADEEDPSLRRQSTDFTTEGITRQFSRQTSVASTVRRISSIREEDLRTTPLSPVTEATPDEVFPVEASPEEKPTVIKQRRDAETMTVPVVQEQVGTGRIRREDSVITEIADERDQLQELRGVPIEHRGTMTDPQIQKVVVVEQARDNGATTIQIDDQQKALVPKKDMQPWWNAFTAEDVDRLLELGHRRGGGGGGWWNAYTAEDVDKLLNMEPVRRLSLRRGSLERRSFRRYPRQFQDDDVDVHIRVRGRQEMRSPHYVFAQAPPEEKAIVLRDVTESADPLIRQIKVDDVHGADAVRVENGVVRIKVGDLTANGRRAWARILQHQGRIIESDGTVVIPVGDQYQDGVYQTSYNHERDENGVIRIPIKLTLQEMAKAKPKKPRILRDVKRGGSFRKKRRTSAKGYIAGAKYYNGEMVLTVDGSQGRQRSRDIVLMGQRNNARVGGDGIVIRRNQPYSVPGQTIQRIHEGYRMTRQAGSWRNEGGKMVINVHAVPAKQPRFNLRRVGENMARTPGMLASSSYDEGTVAEGDISGTSGTYSVYPVLGRNAASDPSGTYIVSTALGRRAASNTSGAYIVSDPTDSREMSRTFVHDGVTRVSSTNGTYVTPTVIPYKEEYTYGENPGMYRESLMTDVTGFSAQTGYGEKFNLRDRGDVSSVQIIKGPIETGRVVSGRRTSNGRYRYGSSWGSKQQETLNGRRMAWIVEDVSTDF